MLSKHVQEIIETFSRNSISRCEYNDKYSSREINIVIANYSPEDRNHIIFELSDGKLILPDDLEFANLKKIDGVQNVVMLGNYRFYLN